MVLVALGLHVCLLPAAKGRLLSAKRDVSAGTTKAKKKNQQQSAREKKKRKKKKKEKKKNEMKEKNLFRQVYYTHGGDFARSVPFLSGLRALKQGNYMLTALICLGGKYPLSDIALVTGEFITWTILLLLCLTDDTFDFKNICYFWLFFLFFFFFL
jgi:hypothetical protein